MTSYKITSIDQNGAVVEIDFGADIFVVGYAIPKPMNKATQRPLWVVPNHSSLMG